MPVAPPPPAPPPVRELVPVPAVIARRLEAARFEVRHLRRLLKLSESIGTGRAAAPPPVPVREGGA